MKATLAGFLIFFVCCFASCKRVVMSGGECGDPPPGPPGVPDFRIVDKQTGRDYFIEHPSAPVPTFNYLCSGEQITRVEKYPLQVGNYTYGYLISIYAIFAYPDQSNQCYKAIMHMGNETDTLQYMYYFEQPCNKAILTGIYSAKYGAIVKTPDSANTNVSYYTLMK